MGFRFSKTSVETASKQLIENCCFNFGNLTMKQSIGIPKGIDSAPSWANLFRYSNEEL